MAALSLPAAGCMDDDPPPRDCPEWIAAETVGDLDELQTLLLLHDNLDDARCVAQRLLSEQPEHPLAINNWAFVLIADQRYGAAEAALRAGLQAHPDDVPMRHNLAIALSRQGKHDEAVEVTEPLVELDEDECGGRLQWEVQRLLAGEGDPLVLQELLVRCGALHLWADLSDRGALPPPGGDAPICIPIQGLPDERSVVPDVVDADGCRGPGVTLVPDCATHTELCDEQPYLYTFSSTVNSAAAPIHGYMRNWWVMPLSAAAVLFECPDPECTVGLLLEQPARSVRLSASGSRMLNDRLVLDTVGPPEVKVASAALMFSLFPRRVIHPASEGPQLGCPDVDAPFYHFTSALEYSVTIAQTLRELDEAGAFDVNVDIEVSGMNAQFGALGGSFDHCPQNCPNDWCRCEGVVTHIPGDDAIPGNLPDHETCVEEFSDFRDEWVSDSPSDYTVLLVEIHPAEVECAYAPPLLTSSDYMALMIPGLQSSVSSKTSVSYMFSMGVVTFELGADGTFSVGTSNLPINVDAGVNPFKDAFDVKVGVGPSYATQGGMTSVGASFGVGTSGELSSREIERCYLHAGASVCVGPVKLGKSWDVTVKELDDRLSQFGGQGQTHQSAPIHRRP